MNERAQHLYRNAEGYEVVLILNEHGGYVYLRGPGQERYHEFYWWSQGSAVAMAYLLVGGFQAAEVRAETVPALEYLLERRFPVRPGDNPRHERVRYHTNGRGYGLEVLLNRDGRSFTLWHAPYMREWFCILNQEQLERVVALIAAGMRAAEEERVSLPGRGGATEEDAPPGGERRMDLLWSFLATGSIQPAEEEAGG